MTIEGNGSSDLRERLKRIRDLGKEVSFQGEGVLGPRESKEQALLVLRDTTELDAKTLEDFNRRLEEEGSEDPNQ